MPETLHDDPRRLALGRAWLAAQGLPDAFVEAIHPDDEMLAHLAADERLSPERHRMEYYRSGFEAATLLDRVLAAAGLSWDALDGVLEFAAGFGRVTRHLLGRVDARRIHSCDILPATTTFLAETFDVQAFDSAAEPGALRLPRCFPLIWVGSLFSHLPEPDFEAWLGRLAEALAPGGLLVFSTHGARVVPEVPKRASGFTFVPTSESRTLDGARYGSSFVEPARVAEIAARVGLARHAVLERELWWIQDVHVVSRPDGPELRDWTPRPMLRGRITEQRLRGAEAAVGGWSIVAEAHAPVAEIRLLVDDLDAGAASLGEPVPTAAGPDRRPGHVHTDWWVHGPAGRLPAGARTLAAVGRAAGGAPLCFDVAPLELAAG